MAKKDEISEESIIKAINTHTTIVGTDLNRAIASYNELMQMVQLYITKVHADKATTNAKKTADKTAEKSK